MLPFRRNPEAPGGRDGGSEMRLFVIRNNVVKRFGICKDVFEKMIYVFEPWADQLQRQHILEGAGCWSGECGALLLEKPHNFSGYMHITKHLHQAADLINWPDIKSLA